MGKANTQKDEDDYKRSERHGYLREAKKGIGRANLRKLARRAGVQRIS
jgi:histone H3/H4